MVTKEDINLAIIAHIKWKDVLLDAISKGSSDLDKKIVEKDYYCDLGKWLISLPQDIQRTDIYQRVRKAHAEFHISAAEVLDYVNQGQIREAEKSLHFGGSYDLNSKKLASILNEWKKSIDTNSDTLISALNEWKDTL